MNRHDTGHMENELKLTGLLNNQLKYVGDTVENALNMLCTSLEILGIQHNTPQKVCQQDIYYDTQQHLLERNNCSLRIRTIANKKILTAKKPSQVIAAPLQRTEYEQPIPTDGQLLDHVKDFFSYHFSDYAENSLYEIFQVINTRHEIQISTRSGNNYTLCFDKYMYYWQETGISSDSFYEIEIEQIGENNFETDSDIQNLSRLFTQLLGFQIERRSKYKQGMDWLREEQTFENKIFILFDFVSYSKSPSIVQRQLVQDFNNLIHPELEKYVPGSIKIPIGDGIILGCTHDAKVIAFLNSLFHILHQHNENVQKERRLQIRTALHYGPIYKYTDINGQLNYAGSGINFVARIASQTDSNQVLISQECAQYLLESGRINPQYLSEQTSITVKHGISLPVRNYFDPKSRIGTPEQIG